MDKEQLKQSLDHLAAQGIYPGHDLWPRIRAKAQHRSIGASWGQFSPVARLGWAVILLAVALSIGMTVYAASPVIGRLFLMDNQLSQKDYSKLGQHFEISQTRGDVTVTLQWAYADSSRVLVGYTIQSADGMRFFPTTALTDTNGAIYEWTYGYGVTGQSDILKVSLPPGEGSYLVSFTQCPEPGQAVGEMNAVEPLKVILDVTAEPGQAVGEMSAAQCYPISANTILLPSGEPILNLHFTVQASHYILPAEMSTPQAPSSSGKGQTGSMTAEAQTISIGEVIGPFTFDFSIPLESTSK